MIWRTVLTFTYCVLSFVPLTTAVTKRYREDYEYNDSTDAFYKLHINEEIEANAENICSLEGAKVMVYSSVEDVNQAVAMMKEFPDIGDFSWITADGQTQEFADEPVIIDLSPAAIQVDYDWECCSQPCEVVTRAGELQLSACCNRHPFICKVDAKDVPYDPQCDVYGYQYEYYSSVGSCYKIPQQVLTWDEAFSECRAEGAHLVVLDSERERQAVWDLIQVQPRTQSTFFAGIKANQSLTAEGNNKAWSHDLDNEINHLCGAINRYDGKYVAVPCRDLYPFVCEKEINYITIQAEA